MKGKHTYHISYIKPETSQIIMTCNSRHNGNWYFLHPNLAYRPKHGFRQLAFSAIIFFNGTVQAWMCMVLLYEMILSWEREQKTGHGHVKFSFLICTSADQQERGSRFWFFSEACGAWRGTIMSESWTRQTLTWALSSPNFSYLCVRSPDLPMVHDKPFFFFFFGAYKVWHSVFLEHSTGACLVVWRCKVLLIYWHKLRLIAQVLWRPG